MMKMFNKLTSLTGLKMNPESKQIQRKQKWNTKVHKTNPKSKNETDVRNTGGDTKGQRQTDTEPEEHED